MICCCCWATCLCSTIHRPRSSSDCDSSLLASPSLAGRLLQAWAWRGLEQHMLCPHFCILQPLPVTARGQSHLCLLASIPCFSGCKVASRELLWETGAPGYLLQRRGLLARAVPPPAGLQSSISSFGKCFEILCKVSWRRAKCDYITCLDSVFLGAGSRTLFYLLSCVSIVRPR